MKELKVLHFFNIAAVPQTLAKYQRKRGLAADVVTRINLLGAEKLFPDIKILNRGLKRDVLTMIFLARKYQVLHVHYNLEIAKLLKKIYQKKKIILTCHGSDIRDKQVLFPNVDLITYSTPDLAEHAPAHAVYVPNIVDEEHFIRINDFFDNTLLHLNFGRGHEDAEKVGREHAIRENLRLVVIDISHFWFSYHNIPRLLELFEYYDEVKINQGENGGFLRFLSLTALQQLVLGGKVFFYEKTINRLPAQHNVEKVIDQWMDFYEA